MNEFKLWGIKATQYIPAFVLFYRGIQLNKDFQVDILVENGILNHSDSLLSV